MVRDQLGAIEETFPKELTELKQRITTAKQETADYEKRTQELAGQLRELKAKAEGDNAGGAAQQVP